VDDEPIISPSDDALSESEGDSHTPFQPVDEYKPGKIPGQPANNNNPFLEESQPYTSEHEGSSFFSYLIQAAMVFLACYVVYKIASNKIRQRPKSLVGRA